MFLKRLIICIVLLLGFSSISFAEDIYLASASAGDDSGSSCANAKIYTWFATAGNWGAGAGKISAGDTVHVCGTITAAANATLFTFLASGTAGNVITLKFETGAILASPQFATTGAINTGVFDYIKIDGGTNGIIQNTDNGSAASGKTYHAASSGIASNSPSYLEICNLTIQNIFINTGGNGSGATDYTGLLTRNIFIDDGSGSYSNVNIHNNTLNNARTGIWMAFEGITVSAVNIYSNIMVDHAWTIMIGAGSNNSVISGVDIYKNEFSDWHLWQYPTAQYHTDGLIIYSNTGASTSHYAGKFRDNYAHGNLGAGSPSGFIGSGCGGQNFLIYNNLFVCNNVDGGETKGACIVDYNAGPTGCTAGQPVNTTLYNNTIIGTATQASGQAGHAIKAARAGIYMTVKNNIFVNYYVPLYDMNTDLSGFSGANGSADYNLYYGHTYAAAFNDGGTKVSIATFKSTYSQENHSVAANPSIDANYKPDAVGDPIVAAGADLTSLGINTDKDGNARPSGSAWTIGAYEWNTTPDTTPPALVTMTVNVSGTTATLVLNENVTVNYGTGFTLDCNGGVGEGLSFVSETVGTILFNITGRAIDIAESCTFGYTTVTDGIEDAAGNDLASIVGGAVTNSSTHTPTEITYTVTPSTSKGCAVAPVTAKTVVTGTTTTFACAPDYNYTCTNWTGTCGGSGTTTLTTSAITADCTVIQPCKQTYPDVSICVAGSCATWTLGSGPVVTFH